MNIVTSQGSSEMDFDFIKEVKRRSGQPIDSCYQCQKCTAGCQVALYTDFQPNQIIRMVQFGMKEELLKSSAIWLCVNCDTCGARCPNNISISAVTDALREIAIEENVTAKVKNIPIFNNTFLNSVKSGARVHEVTMLMLYKLKSGNYFNDVNMGINLFKRGKLPLLPSRVDKSKAKNIFANINKLNLNAINNNESLTSSKERG